MNYLKYIYFIFSFLSLLLSSCNSGVYTPISSEVLTVSEKGEINGGIKFNVATTTTVQSTITYSPIKNIGLSINNVAGTFHKSNGIAFGTYTNNLLNSAKVKTFADLYFGYGKHNQINKDYRGDEDHFFYNKLFTQFGVHTKLKLTEINLQSRIVIIDYTKIIFYYSEGPINTFFDDLADNKFFTSVELSPTISYGLPHAKVMIGANLVVDNNYEYFDKGNAFMGFTFNLNHLFSKKFREEFFKK